MPRTGLEIKSVDGFQHLMAQKTQNHATECLFGSLKTKTT